MPLVPAELSARERAKADLSVCGSGPPAPQSRDRLYVVAWRRGNRAPDLARWTRPPAWCTRCDRQVRAVQAWKRPERPRGRYAQQYLYRCPAPRCGAEVHPGVLPAAVAIDWALAGVRIGDRARPLAPKTIARIAAGLARYARPIRLEAAGHTFERRPGVRAWPVDEPFRNMTARGDQGPMSTPITEPLRTVLAEQRQSLIQWRDAMVMRNNSGGAEMCTPTDEPVRTITTAGHQSLVRWDHLLVPYGRTGLVRGVDEPMPAQTTIQGDGLLGPQIAVDDCTFRMLEPHEIQAAMAFGPAYVVLGNNVEPYCGSMAVLFAKPPSDHETVNDLDEKLVNFWRVLRERPEELARACALTPHARAEYDHCVNLDATDPLELARQVFTKLTQGRSGQLRRTGWRHYVNPAGSSVSMPRYLAGYVARLAPAVERLQGVSLECMPALEIIAKYGAEPDALLYVDPPPYLGSTRANDNAYRHELRTDAEHIELAAALHAARAAVVISGYPSDLYDRELYVGWDRHTFVAGTGQGDGWGNRTEVIWSNRPLGRQLTLDLDDEAVA